MNHDLIIKTTNRVALYATVALFYWVIIYLTITVFDLKIFREHMTETFYLSVLGIFAILGGSIVLNIMSNLSKISESFTTKGGGAESVARPSKAKLYLAIASVPVIVSLLFAGNALSTQKRKKYLMFAAETIVSENKKELETLAAYEFSEAYIEQAAKSLALMEKIDRHFPRVQVIVPDAIGEKPVFVTFQSSSHNFHSNARDKQHYIYPSTKEDRSYLEKVFTKGTSDRRFSAWGAKSELYFPVTVGQKVIVLYFSNFQQYGKYGS